MQAPFKNALIAGKSESGMIVIAMSASAIQPAILPELSEERAEERLAVQQQARRVSA